MNINRILSFAVGALIGGIVLYQVVADGSMLRKQVASGGKFMGVQEDADFGFDDVVKGGLILGAAAFGIKMAHNMGIPATGSLV